jgi:uncharacterized protein (DUF2062 family)
MFDRIRRLMPTPEAMASNRWLRWMGPRLMHPRLWHMSRRGVAMGAAIGVFFAFITPIAQIPLSAAFCIVLRANVPVSVVATLVNTPPTFAPVYYGAWKVGSWMLGESSDDANRPSVLSSGGAAAGAATAPPDPRPWWQRWAETLREVGRPLLMGALVFSVVFSLLAYVLVNGIWHWRVRAKRRRRQSQGIGR